MRTFASGNASRGFSLIELMVVLFIMTITAGIILPRVGAGWKHIENKEFLQEFVQTIKRARLFAMNSGDIVPFRIRSSERLYDVAFPPQKVIPENVDIYADNLERDPETGDHLIFFYPDGSLVGNDIEIVFDKGQTYHISIHPLFGTVQAYVVQPR
ncbi:MAG: Tfp pilus assembly protein FimT/FimU [Syntrophobacteraceae bacterium]